MFLFYFLNSFIRINQKDICIILFEGAYLTVVQVIIVTTLQV